MKTDSIAIGTRIGQLVDPAFFVSWTRLLLRGRQAGDVVLMPAVGLPHSGACNFLADGFLQTECDALLFMDDDMVFEPESLEALRRSAGDYDVLSALYTTRREPVRPIVMHRMPNGYAPRQADKCFGMVDCDVVGLGFTLIGRGMIQKAAEERGPEGVFTWSNMLGEDGEFCDYTQRNGGRVGVNCDVIVGHRVAYTSRWNASENAVEMELENFRLNIERKAG
jgi:hypothetical protein